MRKRQFWHGFTIRKRCKTDANGMVIVVKMNMKKPCNRCGYRVFDGSGRRIRTLTYGVRVRCATITQSRYVLTNKNYYTHFAEFVNTFFHIFWNYFMYHPICFFEQGVIS